MYILYVEDNRNDADLTRRYLARHAPHITMELATSYSEALAQLARCTLEQPIFDLVLTDMRLPDGDGLTVLAQIRSRELPIPVIVLTGTGSEEVAISALKGGADDYIAKRHDYLARLPQLLESTLARFRAAASRASRPLRVLYAEHHPADIDLTLRHLARYATHIQMDVVNTAPEVLTRLATELTFFPASAPRGLPGKKEIESAGNYDLLLLDYRLPGMNALDLLKEMEFRNLPKLPVVLVTGQGDEEVAVQALRLGIDDYLVKNPGYLFQLPRTLENTYTQMLLQRERSALFESEQRYRALFERAPVAIFTKDLHGVYTSGNAMMTDVAGYDPVGFTDAELFDVETANLLLSNDRMILESGTEQLFEECLQTAKGKRFFLTRKSPLHDRRGHVTGLMGISLEITERRRSEENSQQQERLVTVGQMAAGIAHDFNNILAIIMLYTQMLQVSVQNPAHQRHLTTIYQQATHAANLVQQILDFSRRSPMERVSMDIVPFIKELVKLWRRTLPENIHIELELDEHPLVISADPSRLQQALLNMAINARDAMPHGGTLRLSISPMLLLPGQPAPLANISPGRWLCIGVGDSGMGIPPEVLPHIFDPFFTTKSPGLGTGLGLAQVYGIVHQLDGLIQVESQVGVGTFFTLYLPLVDQPLVAADGEQTPPPRGAGETVLLVEDEAALREAMAEMLAELGYQVLSAENGRHAIYLFGEHQAKIDVVVSDLVMPDMGGKELYQQLVREYSDKYSESVPLRMLLVTGYPQETRSQWRAENGIIKWLQKPFAMETFARRVAETLHEEQPVGE